ncbi:MAG: cytidylate kinase-like family protein [Deltaproteobacteria bacterium]|jgi:cytidylate kinase|nr:cytidylate kinase-like family protein [Deltaproteobacteria bacterium]
MKPKSRSMEQIIEEQIKRWKLMRVEKPVEKPGVSIITISREPGSGGSLIAQKLAEKLEIDLFHQKVLHEMAKNPDVNTQLLKTLDEKGLSILEDWISSLVLDRYIWPDQYLKQLMKVIGTIGKHGRAVIVGRGANFILPPDDCFRVRVISPQRVRVQNVVKSFNIPENEAKRRIIRTESDRRAFIRKYFNAEIADPLNYDMVVNTGTVGVESAVTGIAAFVGAVT